MSRNVRTIEFPGGTTAGAVEVRAGADGEAVLAALGLPAPLGTVVLNGTAGEVEPAFRDRLAAMLGREGLAGALYGERLTAVTGGTDAGIFAMVGGAVGSRAAPLVGVAPVGLVTWPGRAATGGLPSKGSRVALEPHHSHFVLVDGRRWGDETGVLLALAAALGKGAPSVAVICGGGPVTRHEALGHLRAGRRLVVLAGSGRVADELAADPAGFDPVAPGLVDLCPLSGGPPGLVAAVLSALGRSEPPVAATSP